jgi:2'-5' RNA ligase
MSERQRLFFALWPSEALREALAPLHKLKRECGGRAVATAKLHITLNFLGSIDGDTRDCLEQAAAEIAVPPFELILDQFGYWRRPRVVWFGCGETPDPLRQLVSELNRAIEGCGLQPERRPYHAHLTLLRKARQAPIEAAPKLRWPLTEFVLVESITNPEGVEYRVLRRWPLK